MSSVSLRNAVMFIPRGWEKQSRNMNSCVSLFLKAHIREQDTASFPAELTSVF